MEPRDSVKKGRLIAWVIAIVGPLPPLMIGLTIAVTLGVWPPATGITVFFCLTNSAMILTSRVEAPRTLSLDLALLPLWMLLLPLTYNWLLASGDGPLAGQYALANRQLALASIAFTPAYLAAAFAIWRSEAVATYVRYRERFHKIPSLKDVDGV